MIPSYVTAWNEREGNLPDADCPICKNKGYIMRCDDEGYVSTVACKCMAKRKAVQMIRASGLSEVLERYTFDAYTTKEPWQFEVKSKAQEFATSGVKGFFIGGQVGCGKTHICTALVNEWLKVGTPVRYTVWTDLVVKLKQTTYDDADEYDAELERLRNVKVLYIDDFWKGNPSNADVEKAFAIINYRYNLDNVITVISSEKTLGEIIDIDEAVGSRIAQATQKKYALTVGRDKRKDWRLK